MGELKVLQSVVRLELPPKILSWMQVIHGSYFISSIMVAQREFNMTKSKWLNLHPFLADLA